MQSGAVDSNDGFSTSSGLAGGGPHSVIEPGQDLTAGPPGAFAAAAAAAQSRGAASFSGFLLGRKY